MTYSIYTMFGHYSRGKFIVGGFKNINNAKDRCVELIRHTSSNADVKLEIVNAKTKRPVGWMHNHHKGEKGYFFEDTDGNFKRYRAY